MSFLPDWNKITAGFSLRRLERILVGTLCALALLLGASIAYIIGSLSSLEEIEKLDHYRNKIPTKVYDVDGKLYAEFFYQKRELIPFEYIPKNLVNAVIAMEDNNFYRHNGLDLWGMLRATVINLFSGSVKQGGSTITQQLAKRLFTESEQTLTRKLKEMWYTIQIEKKYSKNEILERYFNEVYLGHGSYGIEAAAQIYYQKPAREMNLGECAMLAALLSSPSQYSPISFPNIARQRQRLVLLKMAELGYVNRADADSAYETFWEDFQQKNLSPTLSAWNVKVDKAPWFTEHVRQQLVSVYGTDRVNEDGLRVYTTLDLKMQRAGEAALKEKLDLMASNFQFNYKVYQADIEEKYLDTLDLACTIFNIPTIQLGGLKTTSIVNRMLEETFNPPLLLVSFLFGLRDLSTVLDVAYNFDPKAGRITRPEGALVGIDPRNGYVKTLIGGSEFSPENRFNRAVQAYRQPGSSFKPFVYLAAIESKLLTAGSPMDDAPAVYSQANGQLWQPRNYDRHYSGRLVLREALARSVNIITVKILDLIGYERVTKTAATLLHIAPSDIEKRFIRAHSLALGGSEVTPFEMCNAFAVIGNFGQDVKPISILRVYDRDGKLVDDFLQKRDFDRSGKRIEAAQLIEKAPMYILISLLEGVTSEGTASEAKFKAQLTRKVGGKTGTASNWKDIWFAGFTPQLAATVWLGFDDPGFSLGRNSAASEVAAPIVLNYMKRAIDDREPERWYTVPPGVYQSGVCRRSGKSPTAKCDRKYVYSEYFLQGTGLEGKCEECGRIGSALTNRSFFKIGEDDDPNKKDKDGRPRINTRIDTDDLFKD